MTAIDHGRNSTYTNHGCRCDACTAAHSESVAARRRERVPAEAAEHGTFSTYTNYGCRCDLCRVASAKATADWRARKLHNRRLLAGSVLVSSTEEN